MKICSYEIKKRELFAFLFLLFSFLFFRLLLINSDPFYISWSKGILFDPAIYSLNLKNYLLIKSPNIYENNYYLFFPVHFFIQKFIFRFIPYNYTTLNAAAVIINFCSAILLFFILLKLYNQKYAFTSLFLISFSFVFISYSNIFYVETTMLFFVFLTLVFFFSSNLLFIFISGVFSFIAFAAKLNAITLFFAIFLYFLINKNFIKLILFIAGFVFSLIIFALIFLLPNLDLYKELSASKIYIDVIKAHSPKSYLFNFFKFKNFFNTNIFFKMPFLSFLSFLFFSSNLFYKNKFSLFLLIWLIIGIGIINLSDYTPFRYRFIVLPIILIAATITIIEFEKIVLNYRKINFLISLFCSVFYLLLFFKKFYYLFFLFIFFFLFIYFFQKKFFTSKTKIFIFIFYILFNLTLYFFEFAKREKKIIEFNKVVNEEIMKNNDYKNIMISGYGAPVFCINVPVKVLNYKCVPIYLIEKLNIKYIICREDEFKQLNYIKYKIIYKQHFSKYKENIYFLKIL